MTHAAITEARGLFAAAGFSDPPAILLEAVAGLRDESGRRALVAQVTPEQVRRLRLNETPAGRLELIVTDLVAEELLDLRASKRPDPEPIEE